MTVRRGEQYVAAGAETSGAEGDVTPSTIMMMWQLSRKTSW
ncbi:hypothetical protein [Streptomyces sp. enrichment culture]